MHSHSCFRFPRAFGRSVSVLAIIGAVHGQAVIAPKPAGDPGPTRLDAVFVQGRDSDLIGTAAAASQGIVGARELDARPFLRRGELLEVIPGVVITQHSGGGKANQYFLRGFNLDHGTDFSLGVDGMPVNLRSHAHGQGYADINFLIPELVQQVDYNKGPFYAEVGDFSSAGSAEFRLFDALPRGFASLALGENNYARAVVADTVRSDGAATTYAVEAAHDDGPWALQENFNRFSGMLRRQWTSGGTDLRLTALAYHATWRATDQIPLRAVEAGVLDRFGHVDPTNGGETDRASLSFDATFKAPGVTTRFNAYAIAYRLNLFSNFTYFLDDPVNGDQFNQRDRRGVFGGALTRTWTHGSTDRTSETTAGVQVRDDAIGELGLHRTVARTRLSTVRDDAVNEASLGVFVRNETRWSDWFRTEAGLRADGYRFKVDSALAANSGTRTAAIASPKLGLVFGPWAKTEIYLNAGSGFHSNDARGTTIRVDPLDGVTPVERVNPLVRSRGAEVGLRTSVVPGLVSSVAVWSLDLDSELVFVGDAGGTEPTGRTRRYGIEFANYYRATPWLVLDADLALTHARYRDAPGADRIANSLATVVTAGATVNGPRGLFGSVRLRTFGRQPLAEDNAVSAPSTVALNARAGWRTGDWETALEVLNVLGRDNYDIAYFYASRLPGETAGGVEDIHFHPAEPRTLRLSVTRRF